MLNFRIISAILFFVSTHWAFAGCFINALPYPTDLNKLQPEIQSQLTKTDPESRKLWDFVQSKTIPDPTKKKIALNQLNKNETYTKDIPTLQDTSFHKGYATPLRAFERLCSRNLSLITPELFNKLTNDKLSTTQQAYKEKMIDSIAAIEGKASSEIPYDLFREIFINLGAIRKGNTINDDKTILKDLLDAEQYKKLNKLISEEKKTTLYKIYHNKGIFETMAVHFSAQAERPLDDFRKLCLDENGECYDGFEKTHKAIIDTVKEFVGPSRYKRMQNTFSRLKKKLLRSG